MKALIYKPARTAMQQSGQADHNHWVLDLAPHSNPYIDPLMGWFGMTDTTKQIKLTFPTQEAALEYAKSHGIDARVKDPKERVIKPKSYAVNFASNRVIDTFFDNPSDTNG